MERGGRLWRTRAPMAGKGGRAFIEEDHRAGTMRMAFRWRRPLSDKQLAATE